MYRYTVRLETDTNTKIFETNKYPEAQNRAVSWFDHSSGAYLVTITDEVYHEELYRLFKI